MMMLLFEWRLEFGLEAVKVMIAVEFYNHAMKAYIIKATIKIVDSMIMLSESYKVIAS